MVFARPLFQGLESSVHVQLQRCRYRECQRAECAVGRGMGIAAHDGHPRQGSPCSGPIRVYDALEQVI